MKKSLLMACTALVCGGAAQAQTDVTNQYLVNPSFEQLLAQDGTTEVAVKTTLENGLYGWEVVSMSNYQLESEESKSSTGFPANGSGVLIPTDGTYYYFNRQGWGNKNGEIKTTTSKALAKGLYYFSVDYKAADYSNNNNAGKNGTTLGLKVYDANGESIAELAALRRSYSIANNGSNPGDDTYMVDAAWKKMGLLFEVTEESAVTISIVQNMVNSGRSDVAYDNCRLYAIDAASAENPINITGMIANYDFECRNGNGWKNGRTNTGQQYTGAPNAYYMDVYNEARNMNQNVILPAGVYRVTAATRASQDLEKSSNIYANVKGGQNKSTDTQKAGSQDNELGNGWGWTIVDSVVVLEPTEVTIGLYCDCAGDKWAGADNFKLEYLGMVPATEYLPALTARVADVEAEKATIKCNAEKMTALDNVIATAKAINAENATKEGIMATLEQLNAAFEAAQNSAKGYATVKEAIDYVQSLSLGVTDYDAAYNNGTIADDAIAAAVADVYEAMAAYVGAQPGNDKTQAIINPSFEYNNGSIFGWTLAGKSSDTAVRKLSDETYATSNADGDYIFNTWWQGVPMSQTVKGLPSGKYELSFVYASDSDGFIYLVVNDAKQQFKASEEGKGVGVTCTYPFELEADAPLAITVVGAAAGGEYNAEGYQWYKVDNFKLTKINDATAISAAKAAAAYGAVYDLSGRRVARAQKGGIYIINGKKVVK